MSRTVEMIENDLIWLLIEFVMRKKKQKKIKMESKYALKKSLVFTLIRKELASKRVFV